MVVTAQATRGMFRKKEPMSRATAVKAACALVGLDPMKARNSCCTAAVN